MIYKISTYSNIKDIKKDWYTIYAKSTLTFYQSYDWNYLVYKLHKKLFKIPKLSLNNITYYCLYKENSLIVIAPILVQISFNKKLIEILGKNYSAGYLDFVYDNNSVNIEDVEYLLKYLINNFKGYSFNFTDIPEKSILISAIKNLALKNLTIKRRSCVDIKLPNEYITYFNSLSKNTRQNIRTAKNKLIQQNLSENFVVYDQLSYNSLYFQLFKIYSQRRLELKADSNSLKIKLLRFLFTKQIAKRNIFFKSLYQVNSSLIFIQFINNEPAAFLIGFLDKGIITIPRSLSDFVIYRIIIILHT